MRVVGELQQLAVAGDDVDLVGDLHHGRLAELVEEPVRVVTVLVPHRLGPGGLCGCHGGFLPEAG